MKSTIVRLAKRPKMAQQLTPAQRKIAAETTRANMLKDGAPKAFADSAYKAIMSGVADQSMLADAPRMDTLRHMEKDCGSAGPQPHLPAQGSGTSQKPAGMPSNATWERAVEATKERLRFAKSRQGYAREPQERSNILEQVANGARETKMPKNLQAGSGQFIVVGEPYLTCTLPLQNLTTMRLLELREETHHRGKVLILRRIGEMAVGWSSSITCAEDATEDAEILRIFHHDQALCFLPKGTVMVIKEPYYTFDEFNDPQLRIDHPSDLVVLSETDERVPAAWRSGSATLTAKQWKDQGNAAVTKNNYVKSLSCYTEALQALARAVNIDQDEVLRRTIHRNTA